ncbi:MAG: bifunctional riboflavin kinase/FAD synthetase [Candidatus Hydrothermia bacterium]
MKKSRIITIGTFDGVHLGHQKILQVTTKLAEALKLDPLAIVLAAPPKFNGRDEERYLITTSEERMFFIREVFNGEIEVYEFEEKIQNVEAEEFIQHLKFSYGLHHLVLGFNHTFGKGKKGDVEFLSKNVDKFDIGFTVVPPVKIDGQVISSSLIRLLLREGKVKTVSKCLGRFYSLHGIVTKGAGLAGTLGYKTINLEVPEKKIIPKEGVYAVIAEVSGKVFPGACYIGKSPTLGLNRFSVEVHLIGFNDDLYGQRVTISFIDFLRDDIKFESTEELKKQIAEDIKNAKILISEFL